MSGERDLRKRTKDFALRVIRLYGSLPTTTEAQVSQPRFGNSSALYQQIEPITGLVQFLQAALHLADKLGS